LDALERHIRRNVLLGLIAELYEQKLSDAISVKEWLEAKLAEPLEDEPRCTNHYLCPQDNTRWDAGWSCMANDRCPTCDSVLQPYATTRNADQSETIHNQAVYNKANAVGQ
jgi:transcription initiation factor IIE alpha subunit